MTKEIKCPGNYLEHMLRFTGLDLQKSKSFSNIKLIVHTGDLSSTRATKVKFYSVQDIPKLEKDLRKHIVECYGCHNVYWNFLNKHKGDGTIKEADEEHLGLFK